MKSRTANPILQMVRMSLNLPANGQESKNPPEQYCRNLHEALITQGFKKCSSFYLPPAA